MLHLIFALDISKAASGSHVADALLVTAAPTVKPQRNSRGVEG